MNRLFELSCRSGTDSSVLAPEDHPLHSIRVMARKAHDAPRLPYDTRAQARSDIVDWIEVFYNRVRMHTAIGGMAPATKKRSLLAA